MTEDPAFRIRPDVSVPLNADTGSAGATNETATVFADQPFRLRMEVVKEDLKDYGEYKLQARRNGGAWETVEAHDFPYPQSEVSYGFDAVNGDQLPPNWARSLTEDREIWLTKPPWPLPDFSYEALMNVPSAEADAIDILFCRVDTQNYYGARIDPAGQVSMYRTSDGEIEGLGGTTLAETLNGALGVEVSLEDGILALEINGDQAALEIPSEQADCIGSLGFEWPTNGNTRPKIALREVTIETSPKSPRISIVSTDAYLDGDLTEDILFGAQGRFTAGHGVSHSDRAQPIERGNTHSAYEWPLVIRRFADGAELNETGDVFEFRMTSAVGIPIEFPIASVRLQVPDRHLGGTFVESPGRIGPWQSSNGDLYFIMEPAESDNKFMMVKSEDGGLSWVEVDASGRPDTGDLEAVDARLIGNQIHILHQITEATFYHVFNTSDHADGPDRWVITDELAATGEAISQSNAMIVRSDGTVVAFFLTDNLHMAIRDASGEWGPQIPIAENSDTIFAGPQAVLGKGDTVHLAFWSSDGQIHYRQLLADGTLGEHTVLARGAGTGEQDIGAVLPLVYDQTTDTVLSVFRLADGTLWERTLSGDGVAAELRQVTHLPVVTDAVDSQQAAADLVLSDGKPIVLFIDEDTRSIYSTRREGPRWAEPVLRVSGIVGSWVRGAPLKAEDGAYKIGFVYDAGSKGGAGMNKFATFDLE